jgi:anthranilate phosphoribosyltransferase
MVLINSAGAFVAADRVASLQEGVEFSRELIDSGKAYAQLEKLVAYCKR